MTTDTMTPDTSWMTPWEAWAWGRIVEGETADMEEVPVEHRGSVQADKEKVSSPLGKLENGDIAPIDPALWPVWQVLSARFVETVLTRKAYTRARKRPTVTFVSARFTEEIDLQDMDVPSGITISFCRVDKPIKLYGTRIRGSLNFFGTHLAGGLKGDRVDIGGSLFIRQNSLSEGEIRLAGGSIASNVEILGATCKAGEDPSAIAADSLVVKGNFYLSDGAVCEGIVRMVTAKISGNLGINGAVLIPSQKSTHCFLADGVSVGGALMMREKSKFLGDVSLSGIRVEGQCQLSSSQFYGAIDLSSARISDELRLDETSIGMPAPEWGRDTNINLQNAKIGALQSSIGAWRHEKGFVTRNLDGLSLDRLSGGAGGESLDRASASELIRWIESDTIHNGTIQKGKKGAFSPSPYLTIANALDKAGASDKARRVRIALEKRITREKSWFSLAAPSKFGRTFVMGWVSRYGYEPMRATWWFAGLVILFAAIGLSWELTSAAEYAPPGWRDILAWLGFSFESALPLIDLDPVSDTFLEDRFGVSVDAFGEKAYDELPRGLRALFAAERVLGLIILSVLVAGLTGWAETRGK